MAGKALLVLGECVEQTLYRVALKRAGLEVYRASTTAEAMERCAADGPFDLLIADVLMDGNGTGRSVAEQLHSLCPSIRILFLSGCPLGSVLQRGVLDAALFADGCTAFLRTPLPVSVLMGKVWALLDSTAASLTAAAGVSEQLRKTATPNRQRPLLVSAGAA